MGSYFKTLTIERPLVFLCGVGLSIKRDRRKILSNTIIEFSQEKDINKIKYQVMPMIIDDLFKDNIIEENNLEISLLEEIISEISFKTYIFLDSMSTSYELGLFTNSKSNNNVSIFADYGHENRQNCPIGKFIKKAHPKIIQYKAEYDEKAHIYFPNDIVPNEIKEQLTMDLSDIKKNNIRQTITFIKNSEPSQNYCDIGYFNNKENLNFYLNIKTLFYLIHALKRKNKVTIKELEDEIIKNLFYNFTYNVSEEFSEFYKYKKPKINVFLDYYEFNKISKHIFYLIDLLEETNLTRSRVLNYESAYTYGFTYYLNSKKHLSLLFNFNKNDENIIAHFTNNPKLYIRKFWITTHKKKRLIVTYANNRNGKLLRKLHEKINNVLLDLLPISNISFAYKSNVNILDCLKKHLYSTAFYKLDIKDFFGSIKRRNLSYNISSILLKNFTIPSSFNDFRISLSSILKVCFLGNKLPIGFVTSPLLSNAYLYELDEKLKRENTIITRYADDYLISDKYGFQNIFLAVSKIKSELSRLELSINENKEFKRFISNFGDSLKFLGINIVKQSDDLPNKLTISQKYLIETSKLIEKAFVSKNKFLQETCIGKCQYIKLVNEDNYAKLCKIYHHHIGYDFPIKKNKFKIYREKMKNL